MLGQQIIDFFQKNRNHCDRYCPVYIKFHVYSRHYRNHIKYDRGKSCIVDHNKKIVALTARLSYVYDFDEMAYTCENMDYVYIDWDYEISALYNVIEQRKLNDYRLCSLDYSYTDGSSSIRCCYYFTDKKYFFEDDSIRLNWQYHSVEIG